MNIVVPSFIPSFHLTQLDYCSIVYCTSSHSYHHHDAQERTSSLALLDLVTHLLCCLGLGFHSGSAFPNDCLHRTTTPALATTKTSIEQPE